jgi:hypothetical protein
MPNPIKREIAAEIADKLDSLSHQARAIDLSVLARLIDIARRAAEHARDNN